VTTGVTGRAKLQSDHHHQQTNTQSFFTGRTPFLSPNQQCNSTEGNLSELQKSKIPAKPKMLKVGKLITTFIIKVDPHLVVLNMKSRSPFGSPTDSAMRWKTDRGTAITLEPYCICAATRKGENSERHNCMSAIHSTT